jgi:hypothetical protein
MIKHSKYYYDTTRNLSNEQIIKLKQMKKIDWINSWAKGNKKEKYEISIRLGRLTLLEIKACLFCEEGCSRKRFRIILLNFGFEV